ncbi:HNH endonuclease family protein [Brachyspira intermedia]|nr:HNH endonuclease family protein [Brachyspira intermedia]
MLTFNSDKKIIDNNEFVLKFLDKNKKERLIFRARKFANLFNEENQNSDFDIANKEINHFLNRINSDKSIITLNSFIEYIAKNLTFVINKMPNKNQMYINKLFETFNNRGRQLKQHEILKSYLLSKVNNRDIYSRIWDSCSIMDNYIEKNLKDILKIDNETLRKLVNANDRGKADEKDVGVSENIEEYLKSIIKETENQDNLKSKRGLDFYDILNLKRNSDFEDLDNQFENDLYNDSESNYEAPKIRSIISFPMLLLHTLRIFLIENKIAKTVDVKEKELINIFKHIFDDDNISKKTSYFFKLLWKIRVLFDKYVIKFVSDNEDGEVLSICNIIYRKNSRSIERRIDKNNKALSMLQSILYYTQESITQYWLTPFLYQCIKINDANELYQYLMKLDNLLYFYKIKKSKTLSEKTIEISAIDIDGYYHDNTKTKNMIKKLKEELQNLNYYGCNRYWFYKLEFILWYNYYNNIDSNIFNQNDDNINKKIKEILNKFRITSKNSIEHVYPQNDTQLSNDDKWSDETKEECLNSFGNLVLISGSLNSELNNKSYKFSILRDKLKKGEVQSLKSLLILKNNKWDENACKEHLNKVIELYKEYYEKYTK